jgi:hypothetical protein
VWERSTNAGHREDGEDRGRTAKVSPRLRTGPALLQVGERLLAADGIA